MRDSRILISASQDPIDRRGMKESPAEAMNGEGVSRPLGTGVGAASAAVAGAALGTAVAGPIGGLIGAALGGAAGGAAGHAIAEAMKATAVDQATRRRADEIPSSIES